MSATRAGRSGRQDTVELTIAARPENLAIARLALAGVAASAGASREVVADLKLAVTEACTNAILHGYGGSGAKDDIVIRYTVGEGTLSIEVEDRGAGFEPGHSPSPAASNGNGLGMGLMIIRMITDDLSVTSASTGSRIVFRKQFSPEQ
jgi:serine/threonine-protein kinase RsbW